MIFIWLKMQTYGNRLTAVFKWETVRQWAPKHLFFLERLMFIILSLFFFCTKPWKNTISCSWWFHNSLTPCWINCHCTIMTIHLTSSYFTVIYYAKRWEWKSSNSVNTENHLFLDKHRLLQKLCYPS
jgi:hypothetical protein